MSAIIEFLKRHWDVMLAGGIIVGLGIYIWRRRSELEDLKYRHQILLRDMYLIYPQHPILNGIDPRTLISGAEPRPTSVLSGMNLSIGQISEMIALGKLLMNKHLSVDDVELAANKTRKQAEQVERTEDAESETADDTPPIDDSVIDSFAPSADAVSPPPATDAVSAPPPPATDAISAPPPQVPAESKKKKHRK